MVFVNLSNQLKLLSETDAVIVTQKQENTNVKTFNVSLKMNVFRAVSLSL